jgi:hypothetical protein
MKLKPCDTCKGKNVIRLTQYFNNEKRDYCTDCKKYTTRGIQK